MLPFLTGRQTNAQESWPRSPAKPRPCFSVLLLCRGWLWTPDNKLTKELVNKGLNNSNAWCNASLSLQACWLGQLDRHLRLNFSDGTPPAYNVPMNHFGSP